MSQWEANPQLDYSATGDDIDTASQKIIQMFNDVYEKLNRLRTMDASASHSVGDAEPYSFKIDTSVNPPALLCRNAAGTGYDQIGLLTENWGIDAAALNLIASDGNIGSIKLGLESNRPASARTYDLYFAYDTGRLYMFLTGAWQVFLSLRFEDLLGVGNVVIKRDEVAPNGANKVPRLNESGQGAFDITGSAAKIGGKNLYLPEIPDGCVLVFNATRDRWEVAARDDITNADVSTTGEPNKIVKADANGAIDNDTKGSAAKIATKTIDVSNLQDGDVLVYDATTGTFKNKQGAVVNAQGVVEANVSGSAQKWAGKAIQTVNMADGQILVWSESLNAFINRNQSAVGNARALSLRQDGVELANYNGDEYRAVNIITPHLRVAGQTYTVGQTCYSKNMPMTTYLECVTAGVTVAVEPDFSTAAIGDVVTDGGAEWKVCGYVNSEVTDGLNTRLASEEAITAHDYRQPSTTYAVGNIAYHASLPTGWYLECTTPGMTGSGELTISSPSIGGTVTDGMVTWRVQNESSRFHAHNTEPETVDDCNAVTTNGIYPTHTATVNKPNVFGYGMLVCFNMRDTIYQFWMPKTQVGHEEARSVWFRHCLNGTWSSWQRIIDEAGWNASAAMHNSIYRGNDLTSYWNSGQMSADIQSGNFSSIYPGDYIIKDITIDGVTYSNVKFIVMDLDYHLHCGDYETTAHHVVIMPEESLGTAQMNAEHTTAGGYLGSAMWTTHIPKVVAGFEAAFGAAHILEHRELLSNGMDNNLKPSGYNAWSGASSGWVWASVKANLANENMVYGAPVVSSSLHDTGECNSQLAAFRLNHGLICSKRYWWWLRSVANASDFCGVGGNGYARHADAANSGGVRPIALLH